MSEPRCLWCTHLARHHAVDDEELRECEVCECEQYENTPDYEEECAEARRRLRAARTTTMRVTFAPARRGRP